LQITALDPADDGCPSWSPDGRTIAFDSRLEGHGDIFAISAQGGSPRRLTKEPSENQNPSLYVFRGYREMGFLLAWRIVRISTFWSLAR
jgi:hypothetical protein